MKRTLISCIKRRNCQWYLVPLILKLKITSRKLRNRKEEEYLLLANDEKLKRKLVYLLQLYATLRFADEHQLQRKRLEKKRRKPATFHFSDEHQLQRKEQTSCEDKNMIGSKEKERVSCKEKKRPVAKKGNKKLQRKKENLFTCNLRGQFSCRPPLFADPAQQQ